MRSQIKILLFCFIVCGGLLAYAVQSTIKEDVAGIDELDDLDQPLIKPLSLADFKETTEMFQPDQQLMDSVQEDVKPLKEVDTIPQRILLLGDSMVEGLARPFADYCAANGHEYYSVCWYSSTSEHWAKTDTLEYFLNKYDPTFVMVCIGGNELFRKDLEQREKYVKKIVQTIGDRPFVWIGTPNWKDDTGIGAIHLKYANPDRYYDSYSLFKEHKAELPRGKDGMHPSFASAVKWMDYVAEWLRSFDTRHPIRFDKYTESAKDKHLTLLQPMNM